MARAIPPDVPTGSVRTPDGASPSGGLWWKTSEAALLRGGGMGMLFLYHFTLARLLRPEGYGTFTFTIATVGLMATVVSLGWPVVLQRFVAEYTARREWGLLKGVIRRAHHVVLITAAVAAALLLGVARTDLRFELRAALTFTAVLLPLAGLVKIRRNALQGLENVPGTIVPEEILLPAMVIGGALLVSVERADQALVLYTGACIVVFLVGSLWLNRSIPSEAKAAAPAYRTRIWMAVALPMLFSNLSKLALARTDVLMLGVLATMDEVGVYSVGNRIAMLVPFSMQAANVVAAPRLARAHAYGDVEGFRSLLRKVAIVSGLGALPLFLTALIWPASLMAFFGEEYAGGSNLLRILAIGQFINAVSGAVGYGLIMSGRERTSARIVVGAAAFNIVGNAAAIPLLGATGAAIVTAMAVAGLNLGSFFALRIGART